MKTQDMFTMQKEFDSSVTIPEGMTPFEVEKKLRLALLVEIGEMANEVRSFKFWSQDREMRRDNALEELADCFHFLLSIGIKMDISYSNTDALTNRLYEEFQLSEGLTAASREFIAEDLFVLLFMDATGLFSKNLLKKQKSWDSLFSNFYALGFVLGFTYQEMQVAFDAKNDKNHDRQKSGY